MKRTVSIITATALAFSLSGCAGKVPTNQEDKLNQQQTEQSEQKTDEGEQKSEEVEQKDSQADESQSSESEDTDTKEGEKEKAQIKEKAEKLMQDPKFAKQKKYFDAYSKFIKDKGYVGYYGENDYGKGADEIMDYSYSLLNMNNNKDQIYLMVGIYKKWFNMTEFHLFLYDENAAKVQYVDGDKDSMYTRVLSSGGYSDAVGVLKGTPGLFVMHKEKNSNYVTAEGLNAKVQEIKNIDADVNYDLPLSEVDDLTLMYKVLFSIDE